LSYAPVLFSQLAELTAMRDIELMEFSLLKTINGLLLPSGLQLLKVDIKEQPISEIIFNLYSSKQTKRHIIHRSNLRFN